MNKIVYVTAIVRLINLNEQSIDETVLEEVKDRRFFSYLDKQNCLCEVSIFDDGINIARHDDDHDTYIVTHGEQKIIVATAEGNIELPIKVVDFTFNNDILAMHYLLQEEERVVEISFI